MNLEELRAISDETEQIKRIYEIFNEDTRLNRSKAARVEFLTTVKYIEKYAVPGMKLLDIGANTAYTLQKKDMKSAHWSFRTAISGPFAENCPAVCRLIFARATR